MRRPSALLVPGLLVGCATPGTSQGAEAFHAEHEAWRAKRLASLTREDGWLSVVGLAWLSPGENLLGSGEEAALRLPEKAPARAGTFTWAEGAVRFQAEAGVHCTLDGKPFAAGPMEPNSRMVLHLGDLRLSLIRRGERVGLRMKDTRAEALRAFTGIPAFAPDPAWRVEGRFEAYPEPRTVKVPTVIGTPMEAKAPGRVHFRLKGRAFSLEPVLEPDGTLFFIFRDATSGADTYGAGRFLYAPAPKDGKVVLDFNRAENPPCAFTAYATCPLPPKGNALKVTIRAGEKDPHLLPH
jgi:hypothetical protein